MVFELEVESLESGLEETLEELQSILLYFIELGRVLGAMAVEETHDDLRNVDFLKLRLTGKENSSTVVS